MDRLASTAATIGDPVRREILDRLRSGPATAGALGDGFPISRPAVSRHLRVLREHGLVVDQVQGRRRVYRIDPTPLAELETWLARFRVGAAAARFESALDALETEVHRTKRQRSRTTTARPEERTA